MLIIFLSDVCKVNDVRKKLQSNVIEFGNSGEDNAEFDELSKSVPKMDISSVSIPVFSRKEIHHFVNSK